MSVDRYAVIGNPVAHSLSPRIHAMFAEITGQELEYFRLHSPTDGFDRSVTEFFDDGGQGLSVTAPFKSDAFRWVDQTDPLAQESAAVNTIARRNGRMVGYNTDGLGLVQDLRRLGWLAKEVKILILGAGGASGGILGPLMREECRVTVANRTESKLSNLKERFPNLSTVPLKQVEGQWDIVINATSAFLRKQSLNVNSSIMFNARCYDLGYQPDGLTSFVVESRRWSAREVSDGLGMLVFQAAEAFKFWRNVELDAEVLSKVLSSMRS
ncbi:MAG: shikimate dehydrogenase [Gammaproteobacteria bacterium]|nr:shikimate dehydrogenase [Gammaproteobacteria bacterium]